MTACSTTLPASWYTSKALSDLERRAVFLKAWFLLGGAGRFPNVGEDYFGEMIDIGYIVRRISEDWRSIKIFSLVDGSEMRSHLTSNGLIFVALSDEAVSFDDYLPGFEDLVKKVDVTGFTPRKKLRYVGEYNWKTMVDGYQECLHCTYAHPGFAKIYTPTTYQVVVNHNYCQHIAESDKPDDGLFLYIFPNSTLNLYGGGMSCFRVCPQQDPSKTIMEFDYYHEEPLGSEIFENYYKFARTVGVEDHDLCEEVQKNLQVGVYSEGILNPDKENGVSYYQGRVRELCTEQFQKETRNQAEGSVC